MIEVRKSASRGIGNHNWLKSQHTFSFADYYDPRHMGFRTLRVINEDQVAPGMGFGAHPHRDMEIISYIISGELAHKDSMGNVKIVKAGEAQIMSAGTGVTHSEYNPSESQPVHFLQIWIEPRTRNLKPSYAEWRPTGAETLATIASSSGGNGAVIVNQDAQISLGSLKPSARATYKLTFGGYLWIQVVSGEISVSGESLATGDGAAISDLQEVPIEAQNDSQFLIFELT